MKRALHGEVREEKDGAKSAFAASRELPEGYVTEFCALTYALLGAYRTARGEVRARLKPFVWHLKKAADALTDYDTHDITFLRLTGGDLTLETICLDPAAVVDRRLSLGRSAVLFSATLSPIAYYREVLGGRPGDRELELPSPFEEGHLAVAVMDVPADLTARLQHQVVENPALAVHLAGAFQDAVHLCLALAAEHLLHIQGFFFTSSDHAAALTCPVLRR